MSAPFVVAALGWTLVHFLWQGALLGGVAAVLLAALRHARPETRYALACAALLLCLAWPVADLALLLWDGAGADAAGLLPAALGRPVAAAGAAGLLAHALAWLQEHLGLIVSLWAACAGAFGLRMAAGLLWVGRAAQLQATDPAWQARLSRLAQACGIAREVRLRVVDGLASPVTAGWWRPLVLVPASLLSGMPPQLLEALLAHELGHVRRHDYLVNLVQNVIEALLFYHPAVWWLSRRIRVEREQIADDFAARQLGEPRRLAQALSELEKMQFSPHHLAQAANGGELLKRIRRLLRPDTQAPSWKAALPVLALGLGLAAACATGTRTLASEDAGSATVPGLTRKAVISFASCSKPVYPQADLAAGHEGTVTMEFLVEVDGSVRESRIARSSGYASMDEAARGALEKCSFHPALANGMPVAERVKVQYVWTLK